MNKISKKLGISFLVFGIITVTAVFAVAQVRGGFGHGFLFEKIANELGLSDQQKTQAKQILEDSKTRIEPLMKSLKEGHETAKDLGTDGVFNEQAVNELANRQAETTKQLIVEKEKTKAALFAILTPEQRTKAAQLRETFEKGMKERMENKGKGFGKRGHHGKDAPPML